jgi:uncharacterized protein YidB (DUF937 family)
MSLLSNLEGALQGGPNAAPGAAAAAQGASAVVLQQVISMIQQHPGGLSGLLQSFQQGGLGHLVQSWLGSGQNLPITADQLRGALGSGWISRITQATGLSEEQVEQHLTAILPQVVDHLTPNGQMPQGELGSALAGVAQKFLHG